MKQNDDYRLRTGGYSTDSGRSEVDSEKERQEKLTLEKACMEESQEAKEILDSIRTERQEAVDNDNRYREESGRTPEGEQGTISWNINIETMEGERIVQVANSHWNLTVQEVRDRIDDAAVLEGRRWANRKALIMNENWREMRSREAIRDATLPKDGNERNAESRRDMGHQRTMAVRKRVAQAPREGRTRRIQTTGKKRHARGKRNRVLFRRRRKNGWGRRQQCNTSSNSEIGNRKRRRKSGKQRKREKHERR